MPEKLTVKNGNPAEFPLQAGEKPETNGNPIRRARGTSSRPHSVSPPKAGPGAIPRGAVNGSARVNGHGPAVLAENRAASDVASGAPAALAALSSAAGTNRPANAEVAGSSSAGSETHGVNGAAPHAPGEGNKKVKNKKIPPGTEELPADGTGFVDEMHARVDFWEVGKKLLHSKDEKIVQRAWERLLEMKYGKGPGAVAEEPPQIIIDTPRPLRD